MILLTATSTAYERAAAQPTPRMPVPAPFRRPSRPPGGEPASCAEFKGPASAHPHWEQQSTILSQPLRLDGRSFRVADTKVIMVGRRDLDEVPLKEFESAPQALAQIDFEHGHNGLAAGRYCLVLAYHSDGATTDRDTYEPRRWQMFLYDLSKPASPASAAVPFLSRQERPSDSAAVRPYPPVRFDFVSAPTERGSHGGKSAVLGTLAFAQVQGYMSVWGACGGGCCTGALEALQAY